MSGHAAVTTTSSRSKLNSSLAALAAGSWTARYLRLAGVADACCALAAGLLAFQIRFDDSGHEPGGYLALSLAMPIVWICTVVLAGAYDPRFIGVGTDEFRRVLNAGVFLTAAVAIVSYAAKANLARGYVVIALPCLTLVRPAGQVRAAQAAAPGAEPGLLHAPGRGGRARARRRRHRHGAAPGDLSRPAGGGGVRRRRHTGRAAGRCPRSPPGLDGVPEVVSQFDADTVAVLACPEMAGSQAAASSPGTWRRPAPTCALPRPCSTWPGRARRSGRRPACRCCTWTIPSSAASG